MSSSRVMLEKYLIPLDDILTATTNFSAETLIGDGAFGTIYKGQLSERWENRTAAFRRFSPSTGDKGKQVIRNDVEMIFRIRYWWKR
ncbi:hypothetical protein L1887_18355 [Cichorium endivia]|nr:hypothetical protein L1887_18355 [Cichorium endivia]